MKYPSAEKFVKKNFGIREIRLPPTKFEDKFALSSSFFEGETFVPMSPLRSHTKSAFIIIAYKSVALRVTLTHTSSLEKRDKKEQIFLQIWGV